MGLFNTVFFLVSWVFTREKLVIMEYVITAGLLIVGGSLFLGASWVADAANQLLLFMNFVKKNGWPWEDQLEETMKVLKAFEKMRDSKDAAGGLLIILRFAMAILIAAIGFSLSYGKSPLLLMLIATEYGFLRLVMSNAMKELDYVHKRLEGLFKLSLFPPEPIFASLKERLSLRPAFLILSLRLIGCFNIIVGLARILEVAMP